MNDIQFDEKNTQNVDLYTMYNLVCAIVEKENENIKSHEMTDDDMVNFIKSLINKQINKETNS